MKLLTFLVAIFLSAGLLAQEQLDSIHMNNEERFFPARAETDSIVINTLVDVLEPDSDSSVFYTDTIIDWLTLEEAEKLQKEVPKKIFLDVFTSWCRWCRLSDSIVFRHREISHFINQNFYPVRFNGETKLPMFHRGREYFYVKHDELPYHELTDLFLNGKRAYPGYVCLDEQAEVIYSSSGYLTPAQMETMLHYIASGAYLNTGFPDFEQQFIGRIPE